MRLKIVLAMFAAICGCDATPETPEAPETPWEWPKQLNIVLTNDDGWDTEGIQSLKHSLRAAGHRVILVGPSAGASGTAANLTLGEFNLVKEGEDEYSLAASPATCAFAGVQLFDGEVDLLVSGTNDNINGGGSTTGSGTVGALAAGLYQGIPSIALSTYPVASPKVDMVMHDAHFARIAQLAAEMIDHLGSEHAQLVDAKGLLPPGIGLSVNYPAELEEDIRGLRVTSQGKTAYFQYGPEKFSSFGEIYEEDEGSDVYLFAQDYITVTPLEIDHTAPNHGDYRTALEASNSVVSTAPLDILVTSEDRWDTDGPQILRQALMDAGHNVILAAPDEDSQGGGARTALSLACKIEMKAKDQHAHTAPPAVCTEKNIGLFETPPDLMISGINTRHQIGANLLFSGAFGPVIRSLAVDVPGIAVHTEIPSGVDGAEHLRRVADYTTALVARLQDVDALPGDRLLPDGVGLNVNYPATTDAKGARVGRQSSSAPVSFALAGEGHVMRADGPEIGPDAAEGTDWYLLKEGHIGLVPVTANWAVRESVRSAFETVFKGWVMDREPTHSDAGVDP